MNPKIESESKSSVAAIPRRPWVLSNQYGMQFVLSQDNEIIIGWEQFAKMGEPLVKFIVRVVNSATEE